MAETIINQNLPPEYIQKGYTDLIKNVSDYVGGAQPLPDFELAGLSPAQQQAYKMAYVNMGYSSIRSIGLNMIVERIQILVVVILYMRLERLI